MNKEENRSSLSCPRWTPGNREKSTVWAWQSRPAVPPPTFRNSPETMPSHKRRLVNGAREAMKKTHEPEQMERVSIHIGECLASKGPAVIETLLGSCVAVCLMDPVERIGGMNHILLPGEACIGRCDAVSRYAVNAMELLINEIMTLGGDRNRLKAKVFGGAHVIPCIPEANGVGVRNSDFVLQFLKLEGIPVLSRDLGGKDTRRIYFRTDTGEVLLKRIPFRKRQSIGLMELKLQERISSKIENTGDITLFT